MLHPYALVRKPAVLPETAAIDGAPLRTVSLSEAIDAVVSETAAETRPTDEAILAHARVVEAVGDVNDAVLPMRFSRGVTDDDLRRRLGAREQELGAALARVAGCVEVGVRVVADVDAAPPRPPASGREYMERRLGDVGRAEQVARELNGPLAAIARASDSRTLARPDVLLTAAYLVPRTELERFHAAVSAAQSRWPDLRLISTGPWPPYSFALLEAEPA
jgi:hypothetical protein